MRAIALVLLAFFLLAPACSAPRGAEQAAAVRDGARPEVRYYVIADT